MENITAEGRIHCDVFGAISPKTRSTRCRSSRLSTVSLGPEEASALELLKTMTLLDKASQ